MRRRRRMHWSTGVLIAAIAALGLAGLAPHIGPKRSSSQFERGAEGWRVVGSGLARPTTPDHEAGTVPAGGFVRAADPRRAEAGARPLDLAVVFDLTSSMDDALEAIRAQAIELVDELARASRDARLALVGFRDLETDGEQALDVHPFSGDIPAQVARMQDWQPFGGGDTPEDLLAALRRAVAMDWRDPDAAEPAIGAIVVVTDAPPKVPDGAGNTLETVGAALAALGGTRLLAIMPQEHPAVRAPLEALAAPTGGVVLTAGESGRVATLLADSIGAAVEQGDPWMWQAPRDMVRVLAGAYGHVLTFEIRQECPGRPFAAPDVVLGGADRTLIYETGRAPGADWTRYEVGLDEGAGWLERATRAPATRTALRAVLRTPQRLLIRGEYCSGPDAGALAEVTLSPRGGAGEGERQPSEP